MKMLRKLVGTTTMLDKDGTPHTFEVWIDAGETARGLMHRVMRNKDRYAKDVYGAVLVKEIRP